MMPPNENDNEPQETPPNPDGPHIQQLRQQSVSARLPDDVAAGVFATGVLVLRGKDEFTLDFIQAVRQPARVVARIVLSHRVMGEYVEAMKTNLAKYVEHFGPPKTPPKSSSAPPSIEKIYEEIKLPDELLSGRYANVVMVGHSPCEFLMDFVSQFYPRAVVAARVYVSAANLPGLVKTLSAAYTHNPPPPSPNEE